MLFIILFLLECLTSCSADTDREKWIHAVTQFDHLAHPLKQEFAQQLKLISHNDTIEISVACRIGLLSFATGLLANEFDSMVLFDSFSKVKPGTLTYSGYNFGAYEQCLQHGRYVYLGIEFPVPSNHSIKQFQDLNGSSKQSWKLKWSEGIGLRRVHPFHFAICSPDACSESDLRNILTSQYVNNVIDPLKVNVITTESRSKVVAWNWSQLIAMTVIVAIAVTGLISAVLNFMIPGTHVADKLQPFDAVANTIHLFSAPKYPESMFTTINLFRAAYFFVTAFTHIGSANNIELRLESWVVNTAQSHDLMKIMFAFSTSSFAINIILPACFATIKWIPMMMHKRVGIGFYVMDRMIRTLPVIAGYLLVIQTLPIMSHGGPVSKHIQSEYAGRCYRNGWKELLFISNFDDLREICLPISWIMSVEFQLHVATFVVLLTMVKYPKQAVNIVLLQLVVGIVASGILFKTSPISPILYPSILHAHELVSQFSEKMYHTVNYIGPHAIGMLLGLRVLQSGGKPQPVGYVFPTVAAAMLSLLSIASYLLYDENVNFYFGQEREILFASLTRSLTSIPLAMLFYALLNNQIPVILWMARSRVVAVVTRMLLSWFMVHILVIVMMVASHENSGLSQSQMTMEFLYVMVVSFVPACMMYVFVEAPFAKLLSSFRDPHSQEDKKSK